MAKSATYPLLFDRNATQLSINDVYWQLYDDAEAVSIRCVIDNETVYRAYYVTKVAKPFGGFQWYLVCPITGKRANKLYRFGNLFGGLFAHRTAFRNACYSIQTESKSDRIYTSMHKAKRKYETLVSKPYAKLEYGDQLTRRYDAVAKRYEYTVQQVHAAFSSFLDRQSKSLDRLRGQLES